MFLRILLLVITFTLTLANAKDRVRKLEVKLDQISKINTSVGIATIIQVPDRPNKVVLGNQDLFKIEYLDQAITIKPLSRQAKSNLYIYTDYRRFNVELISGDQSLADYVVYLQDEKPKFISLKKNDVIEKIKWNKLSKTLKNDLLQLETKRLGFNSHGVMFLQFTVNSKKEVEFKPEWIWITQNGVTVAIHNLFLSNLKIAKGKSINGVLQLKVSEVNPDLPIRLEMRRERTSYLTIQKIASWKRS